MKLLMSTARQGAERVVDIREQGRRRIIDSKTTRILTEQQKTSTRSAEVCRSKFAIYTELLEKELQKEEMLKEDLKHQILQMTSLNEDLKHSIALKEPNAVTQQILGCSCSSWPSSRFLSYNFHQDETEEITAECFDGFGGDVGNSFSEPGFDTDYFSFHCGQDTADMLPESDIFPICHGAVELTSNLAANFNYLSLKHFSMKE